VAPPEAMMRGPGATRRERGKRGTGPSVASPGPKDRCESGSCLEKRSGFSDVGVQRYQCPAPAEPAEARSSRGIVPKTKSQSGVDTPYLASGLLKWCR